MTPRPSTQRQGAWLPYVGFLLAIAGIVFQGGILTSRVQQNSDRIAKLEASDADRTKVLQAMDLRGQRNEDKLDFLVSEARDDSPVKLRQKR